MEGTLTKFLLNGKYKATQGLLLTFTIVPQIAGLKLALELSLSL